MMAAPDAADYFLRSRSCEIRGLENFLLLSELVTVTSTLIHELQRERGASNLVLGSAGKRYQTELNVLRSITDTQKSNFHQALQALNHDDFNVPSASRLFSHIAYSVHLLGTLALLRKQVEQKELETGECIQIYSTVIQSLLNIVFQTADAALDTVTSPALSRSLVAIFNFIQGKELAGQERATGAAAYAKGNFEAEVAAQLHHLVEAQTRCFEIFSDFADVDILQRWQQLQTAPWQAEIEQMRRYASSGQTQADLNKHHAERWFTAQTQRIDAMKELEDCLQQQLSRLCADKLDEARKGLDKNKLVLENLAAGHDQTEESFMLVRGGLHSATSAVSAADGQAGGRSLINLLQSQAHRLQQMEGERDAARAALEERKLLDRAKLLLMKHRQLKEDQAHRLLQEMAMNQSRSLMDVARVLIATEHTWR